jgi:hypothetical protein
VGLLEAVGLEAVEIPLIKVEAVEAVEAVEL